MPRPRTVISPPLPAKELKGKTVAPLRVTIRPDALPWRVRDTDDINPNTASTYFADREDAEAFRDSFGGALESLQSGALWGAPPRQVPTVAELAADGMAREVDVTWTGADGKTKTAKRWEISPLGQEIITDAMVGRDE